MNFKRTQKFDDKLSAQRKGSSSSTECLKMFTNYDSFVRLRTEKITFFLAEFSVCTIL